MAMIRALSTSYAPGACSSFGACSNCFSLVVCLMVVSSVGLLAARSMPHGRTVRHERLDNRDFADRQSGPPPRAKMRVSCRLGEETMARTPLHWSAIGLDFVSLRVFKAAAEERSLAGAAEREQLALSAVSRRISYMEERLGAALLRRHDRGVEPTAAGEALLRHLGPLFDLTERAVTDVSAFASGGRGHVRLFANISSVTGFLPEALASFLRGHPDIEVSLDERITSDILHAIRTGAADIGLVSATVSAPDLQLAPWREDRLVAHAPSPPPRGAQSTLLRGVSRRAVRWPVGVDGPAAALSPRGRGARPRPPRARERRKLRRGSAHGGSRFWRRRAAGHRGRTPRVGKASHPPSGRALGQTIAGARHPSRSSQPARSHAAAHYTPSRPPCFRHPAQQVHSRETRSSSRVIGLSESPRGSI